MSAFMGEKVSKLGMKLQDCKQYDQTPAERRGIDLKSIEFVNSGGCVPALVAITGVMEW
jgi:hypothetical protein